MTGKFRWGILPGRPKGMTPKLLALILVVFVVLFLSSRYNRLVELRNRFKNAFSQIDVQLRRRYDLIPNLVEAAKGHLKHERETLEALVKARNAASRAAMTAAADPSDAGNMVALSGAEEVLGGTLGRLSALSESCPDLKTNQSVSSLMEELTTVENKIAFARQSYNDAVMLYNATREQLPDLVFAALMGFSPAQLLDPYSPAGRETPSLSF